MLRLSLNLMAFVVCFLFISPPVQACMGPGSESTIFFNANDQQLIVKQLGQKPSDAEGLVEQLPDDADVIAEVFLTDVNDRSVYPAEATAKVVRVIKTSDARVRQGEQFILKYEFSSCGPNHRDGDQGVIYAKVGSDIEDRLVLCPYSRRFGDGRIDSPTKPMFRPISECIPGEIEKARQIKRAAEKGDAKAQIALGLMYEKGHNVRHDAAESLKWFNLAVKNGDAEAQFEFGKKYQRDKNGQEALKWFERAAAQGHAEAMFTMGWMYEFGHFGLTQSETEAAKWYARAAEHGSDNAKTKLEASKKMESLKLAAKKGDADAQCELGRMYRRRDDNKAVKWLRLAAGQGNFRAMNELGDMYQVGSGVAKDYMKAVTWYRLGAEQGDAESQVNLAQMYRVYDKDICGLLTQKCLKDAAEWYRRAADQGNSRGQYHLGRMYHEGEGVEQSDAEAVKWYRLAVEQGDTLAEDFLIQMYRLGRGIDKNDAEAVKWLRQSAEKGNRQAKGALEALEKNTSAKGE